MAQPKKQTSPELPSRPRSGRRQWVFAIVLYSIPVAFFILLETGLRLGGFGHTYPLFIPNEFHPKYVLTNPEVARRYFADPSAAPVSLDIAFFEAKKRPGTFRVFVQGGSTAAGFPFGFSASLAGMLKQRLQRTFPERDIEVVSTALSAVSTYTLLDFSDEIVEHAPDAILIYAGHNEYLGIFGVGSVFAGGLARPLVLAYLRLRNLRTFQLLQKAYASVRGHLSAGSRDVLHETLMAQAAESKRIPYGSSLYKRGIEQYRKNLNALLAQYEKLKIPVFIGTLVSNERDQKPFISALAPETDAERWRQSYQLGTEALQRGDFNVAVTALEETTRLDDTAAAAYFAKAQALERLGKYRESRQAYLAAKDRDELRFRAPEEFNQVILEAAGRHGATVVETQEAFIKASRNGIVGNGLMLEHLHPNLRGYFVLADAFFEAMKEKKLIGSWKNAIPADQAWNELPVTEVDHLAGLYTILRLKANWPFRAEAVTPEIPQPRNVVAALAVERYRKQTPWIRAMQQLFSYYQKTGNDFEAAKVALVVADTLPYLGNAQYVAGEMLMRKGREKEALRYLKQAADLAPNNGAYLLALSQAYLANSQNEKAAKTLEELLHVEPNHELARRLLEQVR